MFKKILGALLALLTASAMAAVDVNKASAADLDSIKGIGPSTSAKIMEQRKTAPFKDWADFILRVPGIGESRAAKLSSEGLTVNGAAFKASAAPAKAPAESKPEKPAGADKMAKPANAAAAAGAPKQ